MKRKQCLGRSNIISLKEENDTQIHDRDRMIKRCEEFYTNLYSIKLPQGQPFVQIHNTRSIPTPPILPTEVSAAIKRLKRNKAPGHDNITADVLKDGGEPIVKRKVHNEYVLPVMVYGSATWALKKAAMELLSVAQHNMERIVFGITLRDHKRNTWIRHQTGENDIIGVIMKGIQGWVGHIARFKDNRWTKRVTEWTPREWTRRQGRPNTRWRDSLIRHLGPAWSRIARDSRLWRQFGDGFLLTE